MRSTSSHWGRSFSDYAPPPQKPPPPKRKDRLAALEMQLAEAQKTLIRYEMIFDAHSERIEELEAFVKSLKGAVSTDKPDDGYRMA